MAGEVFNAILGISTKVWNKGLKKAGSATKLFLRGVKATARGVGRLAKKTAKLGLGFAKVLAAGAIAGAVAIGTLVKKVADAGDKFDKMSKRTGLSTEFLSRMGHAAELSGTDIDTLEKAVRRNAKSANDAANELASAKRSYDQLGVSVKNAAGELKDPEQLFGETILALSKLENQSKKSALAQELFGRAGTALLPMLTEGKKGLVEMMQEADRLGITWSKAATEDAAAFNDSLSRMRAAAFGIFKIIGVKLLPMFTRAAEGVADWTARNREWIAADIGTKIGELTTFVQESVKAWGGLEGIVARVKIGFNAVVGIGRLVAAAIGAVAGSILKTISTALFAITSLLNAGARAAAFLGADSIASGLRSAASSVASINAGVDSLAQGAFGFASGQFSAAGENFNAAIEAGHEANAAQKAANRPAAAGAGADGGVTINNNITNQGVGNMSSADAKRIADAQERATRQGILATAGGPSTLQAAAAAGRARPRFFVSGGR